MTATPGLQIRQIWQLCCIVQLEKAAQIYLKIQIKHVLTYPAPRQIIQCFRVLFGFIPCLP